MSKSGRVYRKFKMSFLKSMVIVSLGSLMLFPFGATAVSSAAGNSNADNGIDSQVVAVASNKTEKVAKIEEKVIYEVMVNGSVIGYTDNKEAAEQAYLDARLEISDEAEDLVYMDASFDVTECDVAVSNVASEEELAEQLYIALKNNIVTPKKSAFMLRVGDVTIYLENMDAVSELFEKIRDKYDVADEFEVVLEEDDDNMFAALTATIVSPERKKNELETVYASENGVYVDEEEAVEIETGICSITFEEDVEIIESYVPEAQILSVDEAFEFLTKENEEKQMYTIESGDCMWTIAKNHNMSTSKLYELNENITEKTIIYPGQKLVITVPEPELSVLVEEIVEYEEEYNAPVEYIYNDSWYTTKSVVRQEAESGYHEVKANVYTRNGKEYDREILEEDIIEEPVAKVVEVGTITPPTFIVPVNGGRVTSNYGYRAWQGKVHTGIDYGISTGTKVMASCGGTVIQAGWNGGYGYCVTIQHSGGIKTRYAHLSKVLVSVGQKVSQGQKIALSGNTGNSTGPHLHFEIIVNGSYKDPRTYLNK
ncbi:MAG: peptidoglycan DD-metalloendopeptidase family protein [Lachnospiraceae bacterium]|nr:peptidoglycan DD-metalloendopeptidase family protein [Lachnospiraceae bacterium]